ncbi:MAG TPA: prepilin-type N-terminal cleavage/methylation domain-containing protein [Candidatus Spyradenecus faecavium]|uniref:Prepilin-type N-terminal cleavage/methylation domain-containing protein n=1 Tax=Candidatus Spyradenecus faecavium TaxID=2840947 RepID=A0A9D1NN98_9BACT|nr:prepilin-type N-terminal cleavage/methylation domain-containing protein [Candidatus Spyradenecus faecavium]
MTTPTPRRRGFTLVELLVVIAIVAVVGAGVAVTYGRNVVVQARRQTTLHEMGQLRDAFARFHADNAPRLLAGLHAPHDNKIFPSSDFIATFTGDRPAEDDRTYGMIEFFERYGLWPLLQPSVSEDGDRLENVDFIVFGDPDPLTGEGWQGPYADAPSRVACVAGRDYGTLTPAEADATAPLFPQIGTRWDGFYRVLYLEHRENEADLTQPIYRRLFLVCAEDPEAWDEFTDDELGALTGNRRQGADSGPLDLATGALRQRDESRGLTFIELLNLDIWRNP